MERARRRKSKTPTYIEGNCQISERRTASKLASDLSSCKVNPTEEDMCMFDLGQNSKRITGIPIKKLMAEEMAKEVEVKRRSPSVIARLMGFDGPPSPQPVDRQSKMLSYNYQQCTTSIGVQKNGQRFEGLSNQKSLIEHQEFKDVYEDLEASHAENRRYSSKWKANSKLLKPEMTFIRQKFMDAKSLSTNERLHRSKEFYDTLEMLESNNVLPTTFLQHPDSLSEKHREDLQEDPSSSLCSRIAVLKPTYSAKYEEGNAKDWKSDRETIHNHRISSYEKREDGLLICSRDYHGTLDSVKLLKAQSEGKDDKGVIPTRIVVLKPNLAKMQNTAKAVPLRNSSHDYLPDCGKLKEYSILSTQEIKSLNSRPGSQEAKEIAKEITRKMRENFGGRPINLSCSGIRGYAGDESSCYLSGSDSATDSEVLTVGHRHSFDWTKWERPSSNGSTVSSVSREAKKRLSERWKMTHQSQDMRVVGRGSTLGEMLAIPDGEMRSDDLDDMIYLNADSSRHARSDGTSGSDSPLGISSRDGWKDGCIRNSYRSRSLPPPSLGIRNHRTSACEAPLNDTYVMTKEANSQCRGKTVEDNFNQKEDHSSKCLRSRSTKSRSSRHACRDSGTSPDSHLSRFQGVGNLDKKDSLEQQKLSTCTLGDGNSSARDPEDSTLQEPSAGSSEGGSVLLQCAGPESESSESCKMADHPSPVSVLEIPCAEDVLMSSECFQSVGAGLRELRTQLQLLKMESEAYAEIPMLTSSVEDIAQGSLIPSKGKEITVSGKGIFKAESWESSYLFDVLMDSGFDYMNLDTFMTTCHSPDCPLGPWVFNNLEKKYCNELVGLQAERKLLFDRINSAMMELYRSFMDPCPWGIAAMKRVEPKGLKHGLIDELYKFLANQEKNTNGIITSEKVLDREMNWLDFKENADVIGTEIEKLVIDDLITEVLTM